MDLGIVTPTAVAIGTGIRRGALLARRSWYTLAGNYASLWVSVAAMATSSRIATRVGSRAP